MQVTAWFWLQLSEHSSPSIGLYFMRVYIDYVYSSGKLFSAWRQQVDSSVSQHNHGNHSSLQLQILIIYILFQAIVDLIALLYDALETFPWHFYKHKGSWRVYNRYGGRNLCELWTGVPKFESFIRLCELIMTENL